VEDFEVPLIDGICDLPTGTVVTETTEVDGATTIMSSAGATVVVTGRTVVVVVGSVVVVVDVGVLSTIDREPVETPDVLLPTEFLAVTLK
jgi:hypothetical protein